MNNKNLPTKYSPEQKKYIFEVLCQYSRSAAGRKACSAMLAEEGIDVPENTLANWQNEHKAELQAILEEGNKNIMAIPISNKAYRLAMLQRILESGTEKEKLSALRQAAEERRVDEEGKKGFSPEDYMKLPAVLRNELEKRAGNAIDAEFSIIDPDKVLDKESATEAAHLIPLPKEEGHVGNKKKPVEPPEKVEISDDDFERL